MSKQDQLIEAKAMLAILRQALRQDPYAKHALRDAAYWETRIKELQKETR